MLNTMQGLELFSAKELGGFGKVFDLVEIAEEEIEMAQIAYPEHRDEVWRSFRLLVPGGMFNNLAPIIYRKHCREILARVVNGEDTRWGTKAEIMIAMLETSMCSPMNSSGQHFYEKLFLELFGDEPEDAVSPDVKKILAESLLAHETLGHDWEYEELMHKLRRKLKREDRK